MDPQVSDELISAYFDGEVTPEQRAAVERLLAESDDAQRELNETARLSALLHSFPREAAPVDLVENVRRQTSQMAIPSTGPTNVSAPPSRWLEWKSALISAVITMAACLIVGIGINLPQSSQVAGINPQEMPAPMAMAPAPTPGAKSAALPPAAAEMHVASDAQRHLQVNERMSAPMAMKQVEPSRVAADAPIDGVAQRAVVAEKAAMKRQGFDPAPAATNATPQPEAPIAAAAGPAAMKDAQQIDSAQLGLSNEDVLNGLREGKVFALVPQPADPSSNVPVVYLTVVDINRGIEKVQVLLKKHSIEPRSVNDEGAGGESLVMFYVVARGDQLAETIKDVELHKDLFSGWTWQQPLQLASNDDTRDNARKADRADGAVDKVPQKPGLVKEAEPMEAQRVAAAYVARNGLNNPTNNPGFGGGAGNRDGGVESLGSAKSRDTKAGNMASRARSAPYDEQTSQGYDFLRLKNNPTLAGEPNYNPLRAENLQIRRGAGNAAKSEAREENDANRSLRVLFVLHPQNEAGQTPNAGAPAPAKSDQD